MTKGAKYARDFRLRHPDYAKNKYKANKEAFLDAQKRKNYGPQAPGHYKKCLKKQKGLCAICLKPMKVPNMDHDHETGQLRDLLCKGCNIKVGVVESKLLPRVIAYLKRHKEE